MLRVFFTSVFLFILSQNAFAGSWTITDASDQKKILKYNGSKIAELKYNGEWYFYCKKGRSGGSVDKKFDTLRTATKNAMTVCDKF